jgi:predicted DNA-binding ribbon-helix-helix protein
MNQFVNHHTQPSSERLHSDESLGTITITITRTNVSTGIMAIELSSHQMQNIIQKRSVVIAGHRTSVSLEQPFWRALKDIAVRRRTSINRLVEEIDSRRDGNLSSAIRVYILESAYRNRRERVLLPD